MGRPAPAFPSSRSAQHGRPHPPARMGAREARARRAPRGGDRRRARSRSRPNPTCAPAGRPRRPTTRPARRRSPARSRSRSPADRCGRSRSAARTLGPSTGALDPRRWPEPVAAPRARPSLANTAGVATGMPGLASTAKSGRRIERGTEPLAQARHDARARRQADRHVGADGARRRPETIVVGGEAVFMGERAQRRRRVRRAAAEPGGDRQGLAQMEAAEPQAGRAFGERPRRAQHEIVVERPGRRRGRPVDDERQRRAGLEAQPVAAAGEGDDAVEFVPSVRAPPEHMQRQIDFGGRPPEPRRRRRRDKPSRRSSGRDRGRRRARPCSARRASRTRSS